MAAIKIWENIERLNFIKSIHQVTLAACCLKFACALSEGADKDFDAIAGAAGITKMTLKNMYRELFPYRYYFITAECQIGDPKNLKNLWLSMMKSTTTTLDLLILIFSQSWAIIVIVRVAITCIHIYNECSI